MNLKNISNLELKERLSKLVRTERKITHFILEHILEFEARKLFADYGFSSMFEYLTKSLGYSETSAYRRMQASRLLKDIPDVATKIENGLLNLTQLTQVQKAARVESKKGSSISISRKQALLEKLENKNSYQTKMILAQELDLPLQSHTTLSPQKDESVRVELTFTKEQFAEIQKAKDLLSHICPSGELNEILTTLAQKFNQSKIGKNEDSGSKASSPIQNSSKELTRSFGATPLKLNRRKYISKIITRKIHQKAQHSCEFVSLDGHRCNSTYQLQIDHKIPLAKGGTNLSENLRILCRTHNNLMARRWGLAI